jgi:hypothetical protein
LFDLDVPLGGYGLGDAQLGDAQLGDYRLTSLPPTGEPFLQRFIKFALGGFLLMAGIGIYKLRKKRLY